MNILIIEDNEDLAYLFQMYFDETNNVTIKAITNNFQQCLRQELYQGVDAVILDINLPVVHGLDILDYVKEHFSNIRVVILSATAHFNPEREKKADYVLTKPASSSDLHQALGVSNG